MHLNNAWNGNRLRILDKLDVLKQHQRLQDELGTGDNRSIP